MQRFCIEKRAIHIKNQGLIVAIHNDCLCAGIIVREGNAGKLPHFYIVLPADKAAVDDQINPGTE